MRLHADPEAALIASQSAAIAGAAHPPLTGAQALAMLDYIRAQTAFAAGAGLGIDADRVERLAGDLAAITLAVREAYDLLLDAYEVCAAIHAITGPKEAP